MIGKGHVGLQAWIKGKSSTSLTHERTELLFIRPSPLEGDHPLRGQAIGIKIMASNIPCPCRLVIFIAAAKRLRALHSSRCGSRHPDFGLPVILLTGLLPSIPAWEMEQYCTAGEVLT